MFIIPLSSQFLFRVYGCDKGEKHASSPSPWNAFCLFAKSLHFDACASHTHLRAIDTPSWHLSPLSLTVTKITESTLTTLFPPLQRNLIQPSQTAHSTNTSTANCLNGLGPSSSSSGVPPARSPHPPQNRKARARAKRPNRNRSYHPYRTR